MAIRETFLVKYLGVYISPDLDWEDQVIKVCSKSTMTAKKLKLKKLYVSTIRPKLEYANTVWKPTSIKHTKMLESVQKRCTKFGSLSSLSYENRLSSLNLTTLNLRRIRGDLIQVFKILDGFNKINLVKSPLSYNTNTRGVLKLTTEFCSHSFRSSFLFTAIIWNAWPNPVKLAKLINEFRNLLDGSGLAHYI